MEFQGPLRHLMVIQQRRLKQHLVLYKHEDIERGVHNADVLLDDDPVQGIATKTSWCCLPALCSRKGSEEDLEGIIERLSTQPYDKIKKQLAHFSLQTLEAVLKKPLTWEEIEELSKLKLLLTHKPPNVVIDAKQIGTLETLRYCVQLFAADHLPNSSYEAMQTLQVYVSAFLLPFFFTTLASAIVVDVVTDFVPKFHYVPATIFGGIITLALMTYTSFKIYDKFRPLPSTIRPLTNYTTQALNGRIEPLLGRDDIIEKVFLCWQSTHSSVRQHPLLVGPAGVGKTVIILEITRRLATGEVPDPIKIMMKGKQVIGGVASTLLPANDNMGGVSDVLERFLRQINPYRKYTIVALDEIHSLMREPRYAEALKSALDTSLGGLPYVIGSTTDAEYQEYIASDPARARRFSPIFVDVLSKKQVIISMKEMIRRQYPDVVVTAKVLNHLYQECEALCRDWKQNKQPEIGKRILSQAISIVTVDQQEAPSNKLLPNMFVELDQLRSSYLQNMNNPKYAPAIVKLRAEIALTQKQVGSEKRAFEQYQKLSQRIEACKKQIVSLAETIQKAKDNKRLPDEEPVKLLLFCVRCVLPALQKERSDVRKKLNLLELDNVLITQLVKEYREQLIATGSMLATQPALKKEKEVDSTEERRLDAKGGKPDEESPVDSENEKPPEKTDILQEIK